MIVSMVLMFAIILNTQIAIADNRLKYTPIPSRIDRCSNETIAPLNTTAFDT